MSSKGTQEPNSADNFDSVAVTEPAGSNNQSGTPAGKTTGPFSQQYTLKEKLGSGTFSVVRLAVHKASNEEYAVKCIKDSGLNDEDKEALELEVKILKEMDHPNIMGLIDYMAETDKSGKKTHYLVTELLTGGQFFDRIVKKEFYSEREARDLVKLLLGAMKYIHDKGVVHRDLKPENLLLCSKADNANIKIADFGFAKKLVSDGSGGLSTACGTPGYVAPEILEARPYGKEVDIWSIGIITYILLCGYPPFHHENHNQLFKMIKKGRFEFDSPYWDEVSEDAKDLISKMLVVDPKQRENADQLLRHPWIVGEDVSDAALSSAISELKKFNARRKFKAAVKTVQAVNRVAKLIGGKPIPPGGGPGLDRGNADPNKPRD
jgi:calcium/calmodulin-dependent protein kinase I